MGLVSSLNLSNFSEIALPAMVGDKRSLVVAFAARTAPVLVHVKRAWQKFMAILTVSFIAISCAVTMVWLSLKLQKYLCNSSPPSTTKVWPHHSYYILYVFKCPNSMIP